MIEKTFVDSNVLIYAHDRNAGAKQGVAAQILRELWSEQLGVLSVQVLQEFYVNVTRKISPPLPINSARIVVSNYMPWCQATTTLDISAAFQIEDQAKISFWDALIVASAARCGAVRIFTEDLNAGQSIAGVRIENPFAPL